MKNTISKILVSTMVGSIMLSPVVKADSVNTVPVEQSEKESVQPNFYSISGTISKISDESNGNRFATVQNGEEEFGFYFNSETRILDNIGAKAELKEGMKFTAFIDKSKPMILIYPPRYSPDVVIVETDQAGTVQLEQFDKNFLNKEQDLKLNISDETVIEDLSGNSITREDIIDKDVLIFYSVVLESYPAQVGPNKIILLEREPSSIEKVHALIEKDNYQVDGEKMIPLRLVAETLGYKVETTGNGAIVSKGNLSFTITRGTKAYGYNKALGYFKVSPELLEKNKTYVPYEFLDLLIEHLQ